MLDSKPRSLLLLMIALAASITNHQCVQSQEQQLVAPGEGRNLTYHARIDRNEPDMQASKRSNTSETFETAPTITSVHQVWTSSSSGRLDELSPEVISKLRNDVPFLAAYALRPRLVGASPAPLISHLQKFTAPGAGGARLDVAASSNGDTKVTLEAAAAAAANSARQLDGRPLAKLAGDFSEYNEETSSLSKSEHHHRRKTSVKRARPETSKFEDGPLEFSSSSLRRRRVSSSASAGRNSDKSGDSLRQLVNRLKAQRSSRGGKARTSKTNKLEKNASRRTKRTGKGGSRRRRSKSSSMSKARKSNVGSGQRRAGKRRTSKSGRLLQVADNQPSKVNEEKATSGGGDVKGGGHSTSGGTRKPPFYASTRPDQSRGQDGTATPEETPSRAIDDNKLDSQPEAVESDDAEIDEEPREVEPKRVGDDDVEEDIGDTVLVEPKSDGVDDDPPLPDDGSLPDDDDADSDPRVAEPQDNSAKDGTGEAPESGDREKEVTTAMPKLAPEGDPRGNRVNRQKPNQPPPPPADDKRAEDEDDDPTSGSSANGGGGGSQVAGGGIGTTLGGGGGSNGGGSGASDSGDDDNQSAGRPKDDGDGSRSDGHAGATPGVEFAADQGADDERVPTGGRDGAGAGGQSSGDSGGGGESSSSGDDGGQFGNRRQGGSGGVDGSNGGRSGSGTSGKDDDDDDDNDLDYRDGMTEADRKDSEKTPTGGHGQDGRKSNSGDDKTTGPKEANGPKPATGHGHQHCDDGSYSHEHDHGGHHSHHDTIEWLRGAIPGEPDDDYPILSRVNATNFRCADQKHAGYYADVDARCQIFHICQADGRQDSFLCPNGTIFSQRTLVCVWWNGFDCEDAPKYYHLNELLYKTTNGNESPQTAALPEAMMRPLMTPLRPRGMRAREDNDDEVASMMAAVAPSDDGDDTSPIDGLVRAMRGRGGGGESTARDATGNAIGGAAAPESSTGNKAVSREETDEQAAVSGGHSRAAGSGRNLDDEDEATIQRKSIGLDDDADEPPARLRARGNIRRRRRRASTRQAPPKLKSRRVSRNSRRRKLRHGVKPRRRA